MNRPRYKLFVFFSIQELDDMVTHARVAQEEIAGSAQVEDEVIIDRSGQRSAASNIIRRWDIIVSTTVFPFILSY